MNFKMDKICYVTELQSQKNQGPDKGMKPSLFSPPVNCCKNSIANWALYEKENCI